MNKEVNDMNKPTHVVLAFILCGAILTGCGAKTEESRTVLTIATSNGSDRNLIEQVNAFNQSNR